MRADRNNTTRRSYLGSHIDDTSHDARPRQSTQQRAVGVDGGYGLTFLGAALTLKIPPWNAINSRYNNGIFSHQRLNQRQYRAHGVRLTGNKHDILRPKSRLIRSRDFHVHRAGKICESKTYFEDFYELGTAGQDTYFVPSCGEARGEHTTDRPTSGYTDPS